MADDLPFVPFDPKEVGPFELVGQKWEEVKTIVSDNLPWVIAGSVALVLGWWYFDLSLPEIPNWFWVAVLGVLVANLFAWPVSKKIAAALHDPNYVRLSEQNAVTGDQRIMLLAPDRFQEMEIRNQNGREVSREHLHEVIINGKRCYEVDRYHEDENVAIASWQAGVSNSEFRRERSAIERVKTDLEEEANKALEVLANNPDVVRQMGADVANELIEVVEQVENPNGKQLHKKMSETLDDADVSDDLLGGDGSDDGVDSENVDDGTGSVTIEVGGAEIGGGDETDE